MNHITTVKDCLMMLMNFYPRQDVQKDTLKAYGYALDDLEPEQLKMAVLDHVKNSPFFPSVHELRNAYADISIRATGVISSTEAWGKVAAVITSGSRCERSSFSKLTWQVIKDVGGWSMLRNSQMPASDRKRFIDAYEIRLKCERDDITTMPVVKDFVTQLADGMKQLPAPEQPKEETPLLPNPFESGVNIPQTALDAINALKGRLSMDKGGRGKYAKGVAQ